MKKLLFITLMSALLIYCASDVIVTSEPPRPSAPVEVVEPAIEEKVAPQPDTTFVGTEVSTQADRGAVDRPVLYDIPLDAALQYHIYKECEKNGIVDYYPLILKVIKVESCFDAGATNGQYVGLMQLSRDNAAWAASAFGYDSAYDPYCNTSAGVCILAGLLKKYEDPHLALMAYNMGEAGAKEYWNNNIYITNYTNLIILTNLTYLQ